ncbi:MAG: zf-HC2 domain-containing protein [Candidatus Sericytochromatia bacterium]
MNHFQAYVTSYRQMLGCPDALTLYEYQAQSLDPHSQQELEAHLSACPDCQATLASLEDLPPEALDIALPSSMPTLSAAEPLPETQSLAPETGQIWLLKQRIDLREQNLPVPDNSPGVLDAGFLRLAVITRVGKTHLGKGNFQELEICPLSEELLMASAWDLLLEQPSAPGLAPCMLEAWNTQTILSLQLQECLGSLNGQELSQLQTLISAWQSQTPLTDAELPRGGTVVDPTGAHTQFQHLDREQAALLALPYQALLSGMKELRPFLAEVGRGRLKAAPHSEKIPHWLNPPPRYFGDQKSAPVLAASVTHETEQIEEASSEKELLRLKEDLLLEIWVEGPNLEFYCRRERGEDIAGLSIRYPNTQGAQEEILTDELGTAFIPVESFPSGEPIGLEFVWQGQSWTYPFIYQGD